MKSLLQPGMHVQLQNGLLRPILVSKQGLYINLSVTKNHPVIIIDRDYDDNLICDAFYKYNIDAIFDLPTLVEPYESINVHVYDGNWIWQRNRGFCDGYVNDENINNVSDIVKQIDILRTNIIETATHNVVFDYIIVVSKLMDTVNSVFETSTKAGKAHG